MEVAKLSDPSQAPAPQVLLTTSLGWHLRQTAAALEKLDALAGLWISEKNKTGIQKDKFRRCWPFHLLMKPLYHLTPQLWNERASYAFVPAWEAWLRAQPLPASCNVVQAICGLGREPFALANRIGALKVLDCPNSHATTYFGNWQRECDLWCPGEQVPVPRWFFAQMNRDVHEADVVLCPSTFVRDSMLQNNVPPEKCFLNPFGVDTGVFQPRTTIPPRPRFVCVGTICVRKGYQYLFRAFARVKEVLPEAELVCIGDYKADFRRERPKWEGNFTHHEHLPHAEVAELLRSSTAFVLPSLEEGFARVVIEAMAAGLPIIATHESGASTLVRDGQEGCIVPAGAVSALAESMIRLARDPAQGEAMGRAALAAGGAANTWGHYAERLVAEYRRRLAKRL